METNCCDLIMENEFICTRMIYASNFHEFLTNCVVDISYYDNISFVMSRMYLGACLDTFYLSWKLAK